MSEERGSRLSRWSQRKLAARHGGALPEPADVPAEKIRPGDQTVPAAGDGKDVASPQATQARAPGAGGDVGADASANEAALDLPSIESLTAQSDYTVFLKKNVPEALRKAALRKLWLSDPVLANLDGLNDYDDDYSIVTAMTMDDTSYKIGRGFLEGDQPKPELEPKLVQIDDALAESDSKPGESPAVTGVHDGAVSVSQDGDSGAPPVESSDALRQVGAAEPDDKHDPKMARAGNGEDTST